MAAGAVVALLTFTTIALYAVTRLLVDIDGGADPFGPGSLPASYLLVLTVACGGAVSFAHRGARAVETLFEHQDRLMLVVAHELRSPLSRALVALDEGVGGVTHHDRAMAEARHNVIEVSSLIEDLLVAARIMSGAARLPEEQVRLDEVARAATVADQVGPSTLVHQTRPILVTGSPHLLRRAISNLIQNAARHAYGDAGGEIRVVVDDDGVTVQDDGPGIPSERLAELRYETPLSRRPTVNGLGLLLAGWVAEAHQGHLVLRNRPEGGFDAQLRVPGRAPSLPGAGSVTG